MAYDLRASKAALLLEQIDIDMNIELYIFGETS
jgi:hypothetical protein